MANSWQICAETHLDMKEPIFCKGRNKLIIKYFSYESLGDDQLFWKVITSSLFKTSNLSLIFTSFTPGLVED